MHDVDAADGLTVVLTKPVAPPDDCVFTEDNDILQVE